MPTIKIHLEDVEYDAVARFASRVNGKPEAVALCALRRLMLDTRNPTLPVEIVQTWEWHLENLPLWRDSVGGPRGYEGKVDEDPESSRYLERHL